MEPTIERAYDDWHRRQGYEPAADPPLWAWHDLILRNIGDVAGRRVLEIGCGDGAIGLQLLRRAQAPAELVGMDISSAAIEVAAQRWSAFPQAFAAQGDIEAIAAASGRFDLAISCETIEHVPSPQTAVAELARVLRPGGRLVLSTPNYLSISGLHRLTVRARGRVYSEGGQPINRLTLLPVVLVWIRRAGFAVERVDGFGHYLPRPGRVPSPLGLPEPVERRLRWVATHSAVVGRKRA